MDEEVRLGARRSPSCNHPLGLWSRAKSTRTAPPRLVGRSARAPSPRRPSTCQTCSCSTDCRRPSRASRLTAAFIGLAFALSVALLVLRVRAADREISRHLREDLDPDLATRIAPRRLLPLLVAVLAILLGFAAIGLIVLARAQ